MGYIPPPSVDAGMGWTDGVEEVVEDDKPLIGRVQYCCEGVRMIEKARNWFRCAICSG